MFTGQGTRCRITFHKPQSNRTFDPKPSTLDECGHGMGDSYDAALDSALESLAQDGVSVEPSALASALRAETGLTRDALESQSIYDREALASIIVVGGDDDDQPCYFVTVEVSP